MDHPLLGLSILSLNVIDGDSTLLESRWYDVAVGAIRGDDAEALCTAFNDSASRLYVLVNILWAMNTLEQLPGNVAANEIARRLCLDFAKIWKPWVHIHGYAMPTAPHSEVTLSWSPILMHMLRPLENRYPPAT